MRCDMHKDCVEKVSHVDRKGYVYCEKHAGQRGGCRKIKAAEMPKFLERDRAWNQPSV